MSTNKKYILFHIIFYYLYIFTYQLFYYSFIRYFSFIILRCILFFEQKVSYKCS